MSVQHKCRPHHLALAIALAVGCTEFSNAQEPPELTGSTNLAEVIQQPDSASVDPYDRLQSFIRSPDTFTRVFDSPQSALKGVSVKPDGRDDLIIINNGASFEGRIDGGKGTNVIHLMGTDGGHLGNTRNFNGLYVSQGAWTLTSEGDFKEGVAVLNDGSLTNNGKINGGASAAGKLLNNGAIKGIVTVESVGTFAGKGTVGGLDVLGQLDVNRLQGAPKVKGNLDLSSTAVLAYEVSPDGHAETIKVSGTASLGEATLKVVSAPGDYPQSSHYTIIEAKEVKGEFGKIVNELAFMTATPQYSKKTVGLTYARNEVRFEDAAITENGRELGQSIEEPKDIPQAQAPSGNAPSVAAPLTPPANIAPTVVAAMPTTDAVTPSTAPIPSSTAEALNPPAGADIAAITVMPTTDPVTPSTTSIPPNTAEALNPPAGADTAAMPTTIAETPSTTTTSTVVADTAVAASAATTATAANPAPSPAAPPKPTNAAIAALLGADKQTASHAIEQLAGGNNANLAKATLNSDSQISATLLSAMHQLGSASVFGNRNSAPRVATGNEYNGRVWLQALGQGGTVDRDYDALKYSTQGLVLGADWRIDEEWRMGIAGGKSDTRMDSQGLDGDLDSWHVGAYALGQNGPMSVRLGATYSNHDGTTKRRVAFKGFSDRPEGRYDANTQQAFAEVGFNLGRANVSIEPFASLGYQRYQRDGYTEKGGAAALKVHSQTQSNVNSTFGMRVAKLNTLDNGMQLSPRFSAGWKHTYGDVYSDTRQRLKTGGKDFTVSGASLDRDSLQVDAGLDLGLSAKHTLGIGLNGEYGTDSRNHGVTGQWRMKF